MWQNFLWVLEWFHQFLGFLFGFPKNGFIDFNLFLYQQVQYQMLFSHFQNTRRISSHCLGVLVIFQNSFYKSFFFSFFKKSFILKDDNFNNFEFHFIFKSNRIVLMKDKNKTWLYSFKKKKVKTFFTESSLKPIILF